MGQQTWVETANAYGTSGTSSGAIYKESTTLTDVSPGGKTPGQAFALGGTVPLLVPGKGIRFTAQGILGTTGKPKLVMGLYWGGVAGVALASSEIECAETVSNQIWTLQATSRVISGGESGKVVTSGFVSGIQTKSALASAGSVSQLPHTSSSGSEATVETNVTKILTLGAEWKTSNALNTLQVFQWWVEILN